MKLHWLLCLGLLNTLGLGSNSALAVPIVSVDANPSVLGVQSALSVIQLDTFSVDITISGVEAGMPLNAFQFGLEFDPSVLSPTSITSGSFLLAPSLVVQSIVATMSVEFAEATLVPLGVAGDGILASITFDAIGPGASALALNNVVLSAAFGIPILDGGINNALLTVLTVPEPVPESATFALFGLGLMALLGFNRRGKIMLTYQRALVLVLGLTSISTAIAVDGVIEINQARALVGNVTPDDTAGFPVITVKNGVIRDMGRLAVFIGEQCRVLQNRLQGQRPDK